MATMRAVQVPRPNGPLEIVERPIPEPGSGSLRIKVQACGICHSDSITKEGLFPGMQYPRVPGHEVAGIVDAVGPGVAGWIPGQRVGVGWHGGYCGHCDPCRRGDFFACRDRRGHRRDLRRRICRLPDCSGQRRSAGSQRASGGRRRPADVRRHHDVQRAAKQRARPGDVVAILGLGGLGHLGVQYAAKMGLQTVAIVRGKDKEPLAKQFGASTYIDSQSQDAAAELRKLGGAKVIVATVTNADAMMLCKVAWQSTERC